MHENLGTIFFYLRNKRFAIKKMIAFSAPIDEDKTEDTQIAYGIYFNSLVSLIDFTKEKIEKLKNVNGTSPFSELETNLINILGSEDNYHYLRELRNSIVHRGYDVLKMAYMYQTIMVPVSPAILNNRNQKNLKMYHSFAPSLFEIVNITEQINPSIYSYCEKYNLLGFEPMTKKQLNDEIQNNPYVPNYAKQLAKFSQVNINDLNRGLEQKYQNRLKLLFNTNDLLKTKEPNS